MIGSGCVVVTSVIKPQCKTLSPENSEPQCKTLSPENSEPQGVLPWQQRRVSVSSRATHRCGGLHLAEAQRLHQLHQARVRQLAHAALLQLLVVLVEQKQLNRTAAHAAAGHASGLSMMIWVNRTAAHAAAEHA